MKNVTISMDEATLAWVRARAGEAGVSVSRWIAGRLESERRDRDLKAAASARIEALLDEGPFLSLGRFDRDQMYEDMLNERFRRFDDPPVSGGHTASRQGEHLQGVAEDADARRRFDDERSGSE